MRIALLSFHYAEYSVAMARALSRKHQVLLCLDRENAEAELVALPGDMKSLRIRHLGRYTFRQRGCYENIVEIVREIRQFRPDVVHCQEVYRDYLTPVLPILKCKPLVLTIHDHKPHSGADANLFLRSRLHRYLLRKASDAVIVHGDRIREETELLIPRLRGRVHSVPHGVLGYSGAECATDWEEGTLLFFGRVNRYKGLAYLVEAVNILRERRIAVRVVIAGTGPDLVQWREKLAADPLYTLIEEYVPAERVPDLFRRAHVVVLPYIDGTQSGVAALALNFGRPVVASDVGSLREMVRPGVNGLLVPPCDAEALANALNSVLSDPGASARLAANACRLGRSEFSWERIAELTVRVYAGLSAGMRRRGKEISHEA